MGCFASNEDAEQLLLQSETTRKQDDKANVQDSNKLTNDEYEELSGSDNPHDDREQNRQICCGYLLSILGVMTIAAGLACTQALDQSLPHSELNGLRFLAQLAIISPMLIGVNKCDVRVEQKSIFWLGCGAVLLTANSYANYGAAYYLPLGVSSGISRSLVMISTYIISSVTNRSIGWHQLTAVIMCITGVLMVTQPPFLFQETGPSMISSILRQNGSFQSPCGHVITPIIQSTTANFSTNVTLFFTANSESSTEHRQTTVGYILCVSSAIISTCYIQVVKKRLANVNIFIYNFWACLFGITSSFCIMAATETPYFPTVNICIVFLFIHLFSAGSHAILVYRAFQLLDPVVSSLILTLQIVVTFVLQYTVLSGLHPGHSNAAEISGAVLIFVGNALVPACQLVQSKVKEAMTN
jgi:drug/metabolite transporter (DMT)-like permease